MNYKTEQEKFWAGNFGTNYTQRNSNPEMIATRTAVFAEVLSKTKDVNSFLEFGANIGQNLLALRILKPDCKLGAIEINTDAIEILSTIENVNIFEGSIFDVNASVTGEYDMTFTCGVLIHINPDELFQVYQRLFNCSRKYIFIKEYYNPVPVGVSYRGHANRLFKRDFAGELMDMYPNLELVDYGFQYHRDSNFPMDDSTWFLMKKV